MRAAQSAAAAGHVVGAALMILGIAEVLIWADAEGLWLAVIGIVMSAAAAEATAGAAAAALAGLRVGDVMTPDPDIGGT